MFLTEHCRVAALATVGPPNDAKRLRSLGHCGVTATHVTGRTLATTKAPHVAPTDRPRDPPTRCMNCRRYFSLVAQLALIEPCRHYLVETETIARLVNFFLGADSPTKHLFPLMPVLFEPNKRESRKVRTRRQAPRWLTYRLRASRSTSGSSQVVSSVTIL